MAKKAVCDPGEMSSNARDAASFLKGLANENRLMILCNLVEGEMNVRDLEARLGIRQPTLSQQLTRLRNDGLVETRRESKSIYYSLASDEAREVIEHLFWLFCNTSDTPASYRPAE